MRCYFYSLTGVYIYAFTGRNIYDLKCPESLYLYHIVRLEALANNVKEISYKSLDILFCIRIYGLQRVY